MVFILVMPIIPLLKRIRFQDRQEQHSQLSMVFILTLLVQIHWFQKIRSPIQLVVIMHNTSTLYGIYASAADAAAGQPNIISNNLIYGFNGAGTIYGLYNTVQLTIIIITIQFHWIIHASTSTATTRGFYQTTTADGIVLKNNIITITRGGTGIKHALYFDYSNQYNYSNRNDLYVSGSGTNYVGYNGTNQATLANWQTATSQDANSVSIDPQYFNPVSGDFTPQQALVDNIGEPVGILTDIYDAARSLTTPDPGAMEFAIAPCTVPPVAGTSTVDSIFRYLSWNFCYAKSYR